MLFEDLLCYWINHFQLLSLPLSGLHASWPPGALKLHAVQSFYMESFLPLLSLQHRTLSWLMALRLIVIYNKNSRTGRRGRGLKRRKRKCMKKSYLACLHLQQETFSPIIMWPLFLLPFPTMTSNMSHTYYHIKGSLAHQKLMIFNVYIK